MNLKPVILLNLICLLFYQNLTAQDSVVSIKGTEYIKRDPLLGIHLLLTDYGHSYLKKMSPGYQISYLNGISTRYSYMLQAGSASSGNSFKQEESNKLFHYALVSSLLHLNKFPGQVSPFISAGAGVGINKYKFFTFIQPGAGIQIKTLGSSYLHVQFNYQISLSNQLNNSFQLNIGLLGNIIKRKPRQTNKSVVVLNELAEMDTDKDGVADRLDSCVTIPGPASYNGCPDSDGDGIPDYLDRCPTVPGYALYNGCPIPDSDGDGLNDLIDKCPLVYGPKKDNGCPLDNKEIEILKIASEIYFDVNKYELRSSSKLWLQKLVIILNDNPSLRLSIEGHTDNWGNRMANTVLSKRRAESVASYLLNSGIEPSKIKSIGYGDLKPVSDNSTKIGRSKNRRTELKIIY